MNKIMLLFLIGALLVSGGCSGLNVSSSIEPCAISDYYFKETGNGEITLTFTDNSKCSYRLAPGTDRAWIIYIHKAYFANLEPEADEYSKKIINYVRRNDAGLEIFFNGFFDASEKLGHEKRSGNESFKRFVFKKKEAPVAMRSGETVGRVFCREKPFVVRIDSDGATAYSSGPIGSDKSYVDIIGAKLGDNFTLPKSCESALKYANIDFPKRVRFTVNNPVAAYMNIYGEGNSVFVEESKYAGNGENFYILNVNEEKNDLNQTIRFYVSGIGKPKVAHVEDEFVTVDLGGRFRPVSELGGYGALTGSVFSSFKISDKGDTVTFAKAQNVSDAEFYLEKTNYGFIIYSKKLK